MTAAMLLAALAQGPPEALAAPDALHVAVVLDDSGSMLDPMPGSRDNKMSVAKGALREVFEALPPGARVGVFALNSPGPAGGYELLGIEPHASAEVAGVLDGLQAGGNTPLGERLAEAAAALAAERTARKYGDYRLLIVTDGEASDPDRLAAAVPRALGAGLTVDVIGVAMAGDHTLATAVDRYRRADDPAALRAALEEVLAESTGTSDAGSATDYELIAPLPEGAAAVALRALSNPPAEEAGGAAAFPPPGPTGQPAPAPADLPAPFAVEDPDGGGDGWDFGGSCCCAVPLIGLLAVAAVVFQVLGGGRKGRRGF